MDSRDIKITIGKVVLLLVTPIIIYFRLLNKDETYSVYENGALIACTDDETYVQEVFNQVSNDIVNRFNTSVDKSNNIVFKKSGKALAKAYTVNEIKDNIVKNLNLNIKAIRLKVGNQFIGFIATKEEGKQILEKVADKYIDVNNINKDEIISINIDSNNEYIEEKTEVSSISSTDDIAKKIIDLDKDNENPLVKVEVKTKNKSVIEIEPSTMINPNESLFMGESRVDKGTSGKKEVEEEVTYINGKKINSEKIAEKIIEEPKDTVIQRGVKNPIPSGIAFLSKPSRGSISSNFGARWGEVHHGIDIAANVGDPINAALDGVVKETTYNSVYGKMIIIDHGNNIETIYGHCSTILVSPGQKIKRGDTIGKVGTTGRSTGPHVHFELRSNGKAINPNKYIK